MRSPPAEPVGPVYKGETHFATKILLVLPIAGQDLFPRVSPLCGQSGKIERVEKARGIPLIFLAPYFVQQKRLNGLYVKILFWIF